MKQLILTGLATEQSFQAGGEAKYFLVFNGGELRVPVTEEAAETVVKEMVSDEETPEETETANDYPTQHTPESWAGTTDSEEVDQI